MFYLIISLQALLCIALIGIVLLQQGKGADMGAAFGGGSNTLFGSGGAGNFITRLTTGLCVAFMITSILLIKAYQSGGRISFGAADPLSGSVMQGAAEPQPQAPVAAQKAADAAPVAEMPPPDKLAVPPAPVAEAAKTDPDKSTQNK